MGLLDNTAFDGQHDLIPSFSEALKAFGDIGPADWMMLFGALLWLIILKLSLLLIDRRDHQAGLTYMFFMMAAGVTLVIALPARLRAGVDFTRSQLWACIMLLVLPALRWYLRPTDHARVPSEAKPSVSKVQKDPAAAKEANGE